MKRIKLLLTTLFPGYKSAEQDYNRFKIEKLKEYKTKKRYSELTILDKLEAAEASKTWNEITNVIILVVLIAIMFA